MTGICGKFGLCLLLLLLLLCAHFDVSVDGDSVLGAVYVATQIASVFVPALFGF